VGTIPPNIDYRGARGSNTGDQFHELWALQQILDLLIPETDLKAVSVEGVRTETSTENDDNPTWDGVDCTLYFGETTLETADRIEFAQLKYSAANPETAWSVARLSENNAKKGNNSVIRKMADDYKAAKARMKQSVQFKISLISNQGLSEGLKMALDARWSGSIDSASIDQTTLADLKRLKTATGLSEIEFQDFLKTLDFSECGSHSRFAVREKVVATVASLLGDDVSSEVRELQVKAREFMLPERSREVVTEQDILLWFGLSSREGLFPCPPDIQIPENIVERSAVDEALSLLTKGNRLVLVHGAGGCGKTTLMRQIADGLPDGSVTVFFDCWGGGRCEYADDKRHLPENAFLHLANKLAVELRLPLFIPRNSKYPATVKSFLAKLRSAGEAHKQLVPNGILLIVIDAADNSVTAANNASPPEHSFVQDFFGANLSDLPDNVRIITSCRTDPDRRASLRLPSHTPAVICPPFTRPETKQHLEIAFPNPSDDLVEQFHNLSNKNPRVQAYAIAAADGNRDQLLKALLPGGKTLPDVLKATFDTALIKLGQAQIFEKLIGALAFLPAPIAVSSIARIAGCTKDTVRDFALDLAPGLRLNEDAVTVADEDFKAFIKDMGTTDHDAIIADIAEDFFATFHADPYSSIHVADLLIAAGRTRDLLSVIEQDPQAAAIGDPIARRQVQIRRLKLSLAACRDAGSTTNALKTVLISAEAEHDDSTLNEVLERELDLSVEFGGSSMRRKILLDPDRVKNHGPFLAQDAVRAIRAGDRITAREQLFFHRAWLKARGEAPKDELEHWTITVSDISARAETILELAGPAAALDEIMGWTPREISLRVAFILVPQLIAAGKIHHIKALLTECPPPRPWDLLMWVPLAMAGELVDGPAIQESLKRLRLCYIPDDNTFGISHGENSWQKALLDNFITACELAFKLRLDREIVLVAINRILGALEGKKKRHLISSDAHRFDGLLRCWLLKETISGNSTKDDDFISYLKTLYPEPKPEKRRGKKQPRTFQSDNSEDVRFNKRIRALFPIYSTRLEILSCAAENKPITEQQLNRLGCLGSYSYDLDYDHNGIYLRNTAAHSVMGLLIIENVEATKLVKRASELAKGRSSDLFASNRQKLWSQMRLRTSEADKLVLIAANAARNIKELRAASSEKLEAIINLSRLILPVSRDDAELLFNDALNIAKEIDREAIDQIDFVSVLAKRASILEKSDRRTIAADIFAFVSGAAERLSDHDEFPWGAAVRALTYVDDTTALAAISRWADNGTITLNDTLDRFLLTALHRGIADPEISTSLSVLIGGSDGKLRKELVSQVTADPQKYKAVIEELAKETLLLSPQNERLPLGREIVDRIPQNDYQEGPWLVSLRQTVTFLMHARDKKPDKETTARRNQLPQHASNNDTPKKFEFDPQGKSFTTPESIAEVLEAAKSSGLAHNDSDLLKKMKEASSNPRDKVPFLNALAEIPEGSVWGTLRIKIINETLAKWKGTPAVDNWCKESLPSILATYFYDATLWLKEGQSVLHQLLDCTESDANGRLQIILEGVAQVGETLNSRTLFAIAEEIANALDADEASAQLLWYTQRLRDRLPAEDQSMHSISEIPNDKIEAIARFLFALMSDIDTRVRWKAAHSLRRLAKLGCFNIVKATVSQSSRGKDDAFRDPTGPFYFLAAKLWLMISLYRISVETPEALSSCKPQVIDHAISPELPHVGIREYAKRALLQLVSAGVITLTSSENTLLDQVNTAVIGQKTGEKDTYRSPEKTQKGERRFEFDQMDTIRYWYEDILHIFPTVSQDQVLEIAEQWILDRWGADPNARWWDNEPRKRRYDERHYGLWSNSHGSLPTIERYGTHLEWNAMYCVVGELLMTHPVSKEDEYYFGSFEYWLGRVLPTETSTWLSDNRGPTPLEARVWKEDPRTDRGWLNNTRRDEFLAEVGIRTPFREGWIVVDGYYTSHFTKREANISVSTALVSPETAPALVRALQPENDPGHFYIPKEDNELQIDAPPYRLLGWLAHIEGDMRFDENDPLRYEVGQVRIKPGSKLTEALGLVQEAGSQRTWVCNDTGEAAFIYEAWCDEPSPENNYHVRRIRSDGYRLWARADMVQSFLTNEGFDLICKVQIDRCLRNEYGGLYEADTKRKTHDKTLHLRADGSVAGSKKRTESWTGVSKRTRS